MPLSICAELREESRVSRQIAENERDTHLKQLWASHALSLALLAEKVEFTHKALLKQVDDLKAGAKVTVVRESLKTNDVSVLKQRLTALQAAFVSAREREHKVQHCLDDALRANRSKTELIAAFGHDLRQPLTVPRRPGTGSPARPIACGAEGGDCREPP
jgi:signal transduction histidine kinase